jgi:hypothetical protein
LHSRRPLVNGSTLNGRCATANIVLVLEWPRGPRELLCELAHRGLRPKERLPMDRKALDRRSLERAASTDPAVRDALKAVHRRVSFMKTQTGQFVQASKGKAAKSSRRAPSNEDLAPYACRRCNACTAVANGVAEIVGTSLANCPWVIAKFRMKRQVQAHEYGYAQGDPEPDPRKESSYQHLCRSGFLGAKKPDTARLPPVRPAI